MKQVAVSVGVAFACEPGDPDPPTPVLFDDSQARLLAAVATIEKEAPAIFTAELAKAKAKPALDEKEKP